MSIFSLRISCDLLSFYYLCRTGNNSASDTVMPKVVVICFHFTIFVVLETTVIVRPLSPRRLWFAFILLSLSYWKQRMSCPCRVMLVVICFHFTIFVVLETTRDSRYLDGMGCDLLSFYYLCRTGNNGMILLNVGCFVVICFHFTIFVVLETTRTGLLSTDISCDLLSFYYLCRTGNNNTEL